MRFVKGCYQKKSDVVVDMYNIISLVFNLELGIFFFG